EFEKAASYRDQEQKLREKLETTKNKWKEEQGQEDLSVTEEDIAAVVSSWTGIPVVKLTKDESNRLINMEKILNERVIGQEEDVNAVSKAIRRARAGLKDPKRLIDSFILFGLIGIVYMNISRLFVDVMIDVEDTFNR